MSEEGRTSRGRLLLSNALDAFARSTTDLVLDIVFVTVLGATAFQMGILNALGSLAFMVAGIPIGYVVDKVGAIPSLRTSLIIKISVLSVLLTLLVSGSLNIYLGFALAFILGATGTFTETAQISTVPSVIAKGKPSERSRNVSSLVSRLTSADQAIGVIAPISAGILVSAAGAGFTTALAVIFVLAALFFALGINQTKVNESTSFSGQQESQSQNEKTEMPRKQSFWAGIMFLFKDRMLLAITMLSTLSNAGLAMGSSVEALLILDHLQATEAQFGALASIGGVGGS